MQMESKSGLSSSSRSVVEITSDSAKSHIVEKQSACGSEYVGVTDEDLKGALIKEFSCCDVGVVLDESKDISSPQMFWALASSSGSYSSESDDDWLIES